MALAGLNIIKVIRHPMDINPFIKPFNITMLILYKVFHLAANYLPTMAVGMFMS